MAEKIAETPLEAAFDAELQKRLQTGLFPPFPNKYGHLIRVAPVTIAGEWSAVALQYTRLNLLTAERRSLIEAYRLSNPDKQYSTSESAKEHNDQWLEEIETVMEQEEEITKELSRGIPKRRAWNPISLALRTIHPELYIEGMRVLRWPEKFEFSIFGPGNNLDHSQVPPPALGINGKLYGQRPDVYGSLRIAPLLEVRGKIVGTDREEVALTIKHPRTYYETVKACAIAFGHIDVGYAKAHPEVPMIGIKGLDLGDMAWFTPSYQPLDYPVTSYLNHSPEELMQRMITVISELADPSI